MKKILIISGGVILLGGLVWGGLYWFGSNLAGGGGVSEIAPDTVQTGQPATVKLELSVWGGGDGVIGRYTDVAFYYRKVGETNYKSLIATPVPIVYTGDQQKFNGQYESYSFIIPPYPKGTTGEIEYYYDMKLDGQLNHTVGLKKIKIVDSTTISTNTLSSSVNKIPTNSSVFDNGINFPVPAMYSKYKWNFASTSFENGSRVLGLYPALNGSELSPSGQFYEATNTDPNASAWQEMDANAPADQPEGFYGGDQNFLTYYDQALTSVGYEQSPLNLDQNLIPTNQAKPLYILAPLSGDGPHGTISGYIKYNQGQIRVIIISSSDTKNEVFISNVFTIQELLFPPQNQPQAKCGCWDGKNNVCLPQSACI